MPLIECHKRPDGIWIITLCFLDNTSPYFTHNLLNELVGYLDKFRTDKTSQGLAIVWKADLSFSGLDPVMMTRLMDDTNGDRPDRRCDTITLPFHHLHKSLRLLEKQSKPIVFIADGPCFEIGFELSLACHHRIITEDTKIGFFSGHQTVMPPCLGTSVRLPRLIGLEKALSIVLDMGLMPAQAAVSYGLADNIADNGEQALTQGVEWLTSCLLENKNKSLQPWSDRFDISPQSLASLLAVSKIHLLKTHRHDHLACQTILNMLFEGLNVNGDTAFDIERSHLASFMMNPLSFGFIRTEKLSLPALKQGVNRPDNISLQTLEKITILGGGQRGLTLAKKSFLSGLNVVVLEKDAETAQKTADLLYAQLNLSPKQYRRLIVTADITQASGSHLVLDCLPEDIELKKSVLPEIEKVISSRCIIATLSVYLRSKFIRPALERPQNHVVLLYTGLETENPMLEILKSTRMNDRTIPLLLDYMVKTGFIPFIVKDSALGFIFQSKIHFFNEVITLLVEGHHPKAIEKIALKMGLPESPFVMMDKIGLRNMLYFLHFHKDADQEEMRCDALYGYNNLEYVAMMFHEQNRTHLYDYDDQGTPHNFWKGYTELKEKIFYPYQDVPVNPHIIEDRLKLKILTNAIYFVEHGYIQDVREIDVASVYGCGFMRYEGGCLSYLDSVGIKSLKRTIDYLQDKVPEPYMLRLSPLSREMSKMGNTFYKRFIPHFTHLKPRLIQTCADDLEKATEGLRELG